MPAPYNITGLEASTTFVDLVSFANTSSNNILVGGFMVAVFIVMTMGFMIKTTFEKSVLASSFVCFMLSLFLRQANLINFVFVIGFLIIAAFSALYLFATKK